ncbi:MAG: transposase [Burkholderiaceae bacterium]|nr:transposase [Burkholderiaceae bacterium]
MNTCATIEAATRRHRRRHSDEFKTEMIGACRHPGVSIAAVALANGLNANLVRRWVANAECDTQSVIEAAPIINAQPSQMLAFLPLQLAAPAREPSQEIQIELCRGGTTIKVNWPASAASECASWMRELLR